MSGLEPVLELLRARAGLVFPENRREGALSAVRRAMRAADASDAARYAALLARSPRALEALLAEVTVGETYFFRDPGQWEVVRRRVLPELAARRGAALQAWSAACSTGEEPYTLAIVAHELGLAGRVEILGTDVSRPRLEAARAGCYGQWSLRGVPEAVVRAYFTRQGARWELDAAIRRRVRFRAQNLAEDPYPAGMDLVICRNVLIYLDPATVAAVARRLLGALAPDGWLLLGPSDPALSELVPCEVVVTAAGLAYRKQRTSRSPLWSSPPPAPALPPPSAPLRTRAPLSSSGERVPAVSPRPEMPASGAGGGDGARALLEEAREAYAGRDYGRAAELALGAAEGGGGGEEAWRLRVRALANAGRLAEAGTACAAALEGHRGSAELHSLHALVLAEEGRDVEARVALRQALYLDPELVPAHLLAAAAAQRRGSEGDAVRSLRNAERVLVRMEPGGEVPGADGEPAARMLSAVRARLALLAEGVA